MKEYKFWSRSGDMLSVAIRDGWFSVRISDTRRGRAGYEMGVGDMVKVVEVLRGMAESVNDGRGLVADSDGGRVSFSLSHQYEPYPSYLAKARLDDGGVVTEAHYLLSVDEALALMLCVERAIPYMMIGI